MSFPKAEYPEEIAVERLYQQLLKDVEIVAEFYTKHGGRPIFKVRLTAEERRQQAADPAMRQQMLSDAKKKSLGDEVAVIEELRRAEGGA